MAKLHIVRASAGSGKTFRLTLQYLSGLFSDSDNFRHILAVTFTNKAAEEMKTRIIRVLYQLSKGEPSLYLEPLVSLTKMEEKNIRLKSSNILRKILHRYSYFSVETIDAFFQTVIRSFTREMGIQNGFKIELDHKPILSKAIDNLLDSVDEDKELLDWLLRFAEANMEGSSGWNLKKEITRLAGEIFREKFKEKSDVLLKKIHDKNFMKSYISDLRKISDEFENHLISLGESGVAEMEKSGYLTDRFYQKSRGPAGFLKNLSKGEIKPPNSYVLAVMEDPDKWCGSQKDLSLQSFCSNILHPLLKEAVEHYRNNYLFYNTANTILSNIYTLGILSDISSQVNRLTRERNLFLLSNSAELINRVIDNNDAPFIYEKTGNYFREFFIDEFQDTSGFQWKNFKPLISNSLSQGNNCLVVGDVKQSIYRWRNSNWEIMANEVTGDFYSDAVQTETLGYNRRSSTKIVEFNNCLFKVLPGLFAGKIDSEAEGFNSADTIGRLFDDVVQHSPDEKKNDGFIRFSFLEEEKSNRNPEESVVMMKLAESLNLLQDNGFRLKDIAILTRGKKEGKEIADFLIGYAQQNTGKHRYEVLSDESLYIGASVSVGFMVSLLRYFIAPDDDVNNFCILSDYLNHFNKKDEGSQIIIPEYDRNNPGESMKAVLPAQLFQLMNSREDYSLPELIQKIISIFSLNKSDGETAYIMAFKDVVLEFTSHYSSNITFFLEYWDEVCSEKSVSGSESQDAIRILTIHKSKGLEFEAVIIPYCDWDIDKSDRILWCNPATEPFNRIEVLPVPYSSKLIDTIFLKDYYEEKLKSYIDNLNLLYVSFTRAKKALICFARKSNGESLSKISHFLGQIFTGESDPLLKENFNPVLSEFQYGKLSPPEQDTSGKEDIRILNGTGEFDTTKRLRIAFQGKEFLTEDESEFQPLNYGKIMHDLFSGIRTLKDIAPSIEKMYYQGKINLREKEFLLRDLPSLFTDIQVNSWFTGEWKMLNERDILMKGNEIRRPDRVLIKENKAIIIDFKFGQRELNDHKNQVLGYRRLLSEAGYESVECYLWYITKRKVVMVNET